MTWTRRLAALADLLLRPHEAERNAAEAADQTRDEVRMREQIEVDVRAVTGSVQRDGDSPPR